MSSTLSISVAWEELKEKKVKYAVKITPSKTSYFSGDPFYENQREVYYFVTIDAEGPLDACLKAEATYGGYAIKATKVEQSNTKEER